MKSLLLIPVITLTVYLLYVYWRHGMTKSISATYKKLNEWEKPFFTIVLWAVAIPVIVVGIDAVPENQPQILFFLAGSGICLVGASPKYWSGKMELIAHLIGSYGGIGLGVIACIVYLSSPLTLLLIIPFAFFVLSQTIDDLKLQNHTYWVEIVSLLIVTAVLWLN
jgi:hypothetical protein